MNFIANDFCAGAARADITPPVGTLLFGYNPHQVSTSVHDPLDVTVLALSENGTMVLMVTVTVGCLQNALANELRAAVGDAVGIPASRVILSATHTHSAPNTAGMEGWGEVDRPYVDEILLPGMLDAAKRAMDSMVPAEFAVGETESRVGINRREQVRNGGIKLGQNPWGCYDPTMTCIAIRAKDDKRGILNLIHYGCHGTAAGCNREISRDWSGVMVDMMTKNTGILTAFWNGTEGDVGPRLTNGSTVGDITHVEQLGGVAAADAYRAWRACGSYSTGGLRVFEDTVSIPYKQLPELADVQRILASYENPEELYNLGRLTYSYWKSAEELLLSGGVVPPAFTFEQTLVAFGDIVFVPFPFEMFSEITLRLRAYSPYRYTLCLSNTNGGNAYLPTEDQIVRGGYEIGCFQYGTVYSMVNNADQHIIDENLRILSKETV